MRSTQIPLQVVRVLRLFFPTRRGSSRSERPRCPCDQSHGLCNQDVHHQFVRGDGIRIHPTQTDIVLNRGRERHTTMVYLRSTNLSAACGVDQPRSRQPCRPTTYLDEQLRSPSFPCRMPCIRYEVELKLRPGFLQLPSRLSLESHPGRQNCEEWKAGQPGGPTGHTTSYLPWTTTQGMWRLSYGVKKMVNI